MMLDLHIEGAAPVTLLVRDESRSTRSTSVNKDEDVEEFPEAAQKQPTSHSGIFPLFLSHEAEFEPPYLRNPLFDFKKFLQGLSLGIYLNDSQVWVNSGEKIFLTFF